MSMHPHVESRRVRYLQEHDVFVLEQHPVNVRIGDLGVISGGIGIPSPWRSPIFDRD